MRPTKLTPQLHRALVESLEAGTPKAVAAARTGITPRALATWLQAGDRGIAPYDKFALEVRLIEVKLAGKQLRTIFRAARGEHPHGDWRAAAWFLARRFPKLYGDSEDE